MDQWLTARHTLFHRQDTWCYDVPLTATSDYKECKRHTSMCHANTQTYTVYRQYSFRRIHILGCHHSLMHMCRFAPQITTRSPKATMKQAWIATSMIHRQHCGIQQLMMTQLLCSYIALLLADGLFLDSRSNIPSKHFHLKGDWVPHVVFRQ